MLKQEDLIKELIKTVMGEFAQSHECEDMATKAYEMGRQYAKTGKFDNSKFYHNYIFSLDDGAKISSSSFFNQFMSRNQTHAYLQAEAAVNAIFPDEQDLLFHLVRDKRNGINGVFKAIMSPKEPQQLNVNDFILIIAAFCLGATPRI